MTSSTCPHCGRPMVPVRAGATLTPLKARIYDAVARAGRDGIAGDDLHMLIYGDLRVSRYTLKAHIWQINDMLEDRSARIVGQRGHGGCYRIARHV